MKKVSLPQTEKLVSVVETLRKKCPWDKKQTHKSLIPYLLEEAYETIEAIESRNSTQFREELGDVLLQVVLHSEIAREKGKFSFEDVSSSITEKMIRRHPHVFGKAKIKSAEDQTKNWSKIKAAERPKESLLGGIPKSMPALVLAQRYGEIAASVNFDWPNLDKVMEKFEEELGELQDEIKKPKRDKDDLEMELGDVLFVLTRVAAHLKLDAERALRRSSEKFQKRFKFMEDEMRKQNKSLSDCSLSELEAVWSRAKQVPAQTRVRG